MLRSVNELPYVSGSLHQTAEFPDIDGTGFIESSIMDSKIMRDGNFGTGTVKLKEFDIHYEVEKPTGSMGTH